jgi:hypothetical protein
VINGRREWGKIVARAISILLLALAFVCALLLLLQPSNQYDWMGAEGLDSPVDSESVSRVRMWGVGVLVLSGAAAVLAVIGTRERAIKAPLVWVAMIPAGYAVLRLLL